MSVPNPSQSSMSMGGSQVAERIEASDRVAIRPFRVEVSQAQIDELRRRLQATRWPEKETVPDQSQGVPLATMSCAEKNCLR